MIIIVSMRTVYVLNITDCVKTLGNKYAKRYVVCVAPWKALEEITGQAYRNSWNTTPVIAVKFWEMVQIT